MYRKTKKLFAVCLVVSMLLTMTVFSSVASAATAGDRLKGNDRYETALNIVKTGWTSSKYAVLATGENFADALAAAPLAKAYDAPILFVEPGNATQLEAVKAQLTALGATDIFIVGGPGAVAQSVEDDLKAAGKTVDRLAGLTRVETSVAIANKVAEKVGTISEVVVVNEEAYADALAMSSIAANKGMPILLVYKDSVPDAVKNFLAGKTITKSYIVGETGVVSNAVFYAFTAPVRLGGANRYATEYKVLSSFALDYTNVFVATGEAFPDALAASAYAAKLNAPIVLVENTLTADLVNLVKTNAKADTKVIAVGGTAVVPDAVVNGLVADINGNALTVEVSATGAKKLTVKFNKAVADTSKMVFTVKRNNVLVNIAEVKWNDAKTEATLVASYYLQDGDYTVAAKYGDDAAITATAEDVKAAKVSKITFLTNNAVITDASSAGDKLAIKTNIKIENQYGEDVTDSIGTGDVSVSTSKGNGAAATLSKGVLKITDSSVYTVDQKVVVTVVHNGTSTIGSATLTVAQSANVDSITLGELSTDEDVKVLYKSTADFTKYYLPLEVKDQYGNKLAAADLTGLTILSSNEAIVGKPTLQTKDGKTILQLAEPNGKSATPSPTNQFGIAVITVVSANGKSASVNVEVKDDAKADVFTLLQPTVVVKANTEFKLPFEAFNQYGTKLVSATDLPSSDTTPKTSINVAGVNISVTNGMLKVATDYANKNARTLVVKPNPGVKTLVLTAISSTAKVSQLNLNVEAEPVPTTISGLKNFAKGIQLKASSPLTEDLTYANVLLKDQYGDSIQRGGYTLTIAANTGSGAGTKVTVVNDIANSKFVFTGAAAGTETFKIQLKNGADVVDEYTFSMETVELKNITDFVIDDLDKLYVGKTSAADSNTHDLTYSVYGLKGTMKVVIDDANLVKDQVIDIAGIDVDTYGTIGVTTVIDTKSADKTAKLTVLVEGNDGPVAINKTLTYNNANPVATEFTVRNGSNDKEITDPVITVAKTDIDGKNVSSTANNAAFYFEVVDQYGVAIEDASYVVTNISRAGENVTVTSHVVSLSSGLVSGDSFQITAFTSNGLMKTIKVFLQ